jgi:hypothetical protein
MNPESARTFLDFFDGLRFESPARILGSRSWFATPDLPIPPPAARLPPLPLCFTGLDLRLETSYVPVRLPVWSSPPAPPAVLDRDFGGLALPLRRVDWAAALGAKIDLGAVVPPFAGCGRLGEPVLSDSEASGSPSTPAARRFVVAIVIVGRVRLMRVLCSDWAFLGPRVWMTDEDEQASRNENEKAAK